MQDINSSMPAGAKDSAAETDSLLWQYVSLLGEGMGSHGRVPSPTTGAPSVPSCPREQLRSLPRAELEGRLESTLIIIEALSLQLRDWQDCQRPLPAVGPAGQRDAHTQTDVTRPRGVSVPSCRAASHCMQEGLSMACGTGLECWWGGAGVAHVLPCL